MKKITPSDAEKWIEPDIFVYKNNWYRVLSNFVCRKIPKVKNGQNKETNTV